MYTLFALFISFLVVAGCAEGSAVKPLTPTEVQVITQVVSHRLILPKLTDATSRATVIRGIQAAKLALETTNPVDLLKNLGTYLGPENADITALITVLVQERVDLTKLPEIQGKAYVFAVLDGVEGGLTQGSAS